jgi:hypothetical protein
MRATAQRPSQQRSGPLVGRSIAAAREVVSEPGIGATRFSTREDDEL